MFFFSNEKYKLTAYPCLCVSMLFKSLLGVKIEITSRLHCIDIYDDDCTLLKNLPEVGVSVWNPVNLERKILQIMFYNKVSGRELIFKSL